MRADMEAVTKLLQLMTLAVGIGGGLFAILKAIAEQKRSNEQRRIDLRWRQAEMAKRCLDELFQNYQAKAALKMMDWEGRIFERFGGKHTQQITHQMRRNALRTKNAVFPPGDDGPFIRDAFDSLFDNFERLEQFVRIELIRFEDVKDALRYYVGKMAQNEDRQVVEKFLRAYEFNLATDFLNRFQEWRSVGIQTEPEMRALQKPS